MAEVKNRTAEMSQAKEELETDIAERKRAEEVCAGRFPIRSTK
jgi:hypothetical protein